MAATCMAVCKGSRKKIRGIFISSCHLPVAVECDIVILSEPGPIPQAPVGQFCRHNLSPRGDGNIYQTLWQQSRLDTTYPREGTETNELVRDSDANMLTQLIPARGRKQHISCGIIRHDVTQLIPARGRKQILDGASCGKSGHNLSPRGDGNLAGLPLLQQGHRHNLSPRGDGNAVLWQSNHP